MILSVSRRTDIPAFYFDWFLRRLREGSLLVEHPRNPTRLSRVMLTPDVVDGMVFWSKNPAPMLPHLEELNQRGIPFYLQFTLTPSGPPWEPHFPSLPARVRAFQQLSIALGPQRVIWRYDPIILDQAHPVSWHLAQFTALYQQLHGFTRRCVISFVDPYRHLRGRFSAPSLQEIFQLAEGFSRIARGGSMELVTCSELVDLSSFGIGHGACIDPALVEELLGCPIRAKKDRTQRPACGCMESIDVGSYNTCPGGCAYCYAVNSAAVLQRIRLYDPQSPALCRQLSGQEILFQRQMKTIKMDIPNSHKKGSRP